jgi:transposase InsO family protein
MAKAAKKVPYSLSKISHRLNISRSNYYAWISKERIDESELLDVEMIRAIFLEKKEKVGIRQLKMLIFRRFNKVMNRKKIARLKRKYGLVTLIRRKKRFRFFQKLKQEHKTTPNVLNRKFKRRAADEVYSTDITQLNYGKGSKAYLAVFKDLGTKEIVASQLSTRPDVRLVGSALDLAIRRLPHQKRKRLMIHSDQGFHFTHFSYRKKLKDNGITQSMSRKGNCIDNAPVESFFGYIKDHLELNECENFAQLKDQVTKEIKYYNYERPQWDLKKMPPKQYRRHLTLSRGFY